MKEIIGQQNSAKVFTDKIDEFSESQIQTLCDQDFIKDSKIRIMPDSEEIERTATKLQKRNFPSVEQIQDKQIFSNFRE